MNSNGVISPTKLIAAPAFRIFDDLQKTHFVIYLNYCIFGVFQSEMKKVKK